MRHPLSNRDMSHFRFTAAEPMTRFRFTLRELFLVTAIAVLALGWSIDHARLSRQRDRALIELQQERFRRYLDNRYRWRQDDSRSTENPSQTRERDGDEDLRSQL